MEFIIFIAFVVLAVLLWNGYVRTKKTESDDAIDKWIPGGPGKNPDQHPLARFNTPAEADKPADVAGSENRVEVPAPTVADATAENKAAAVAKAKKAPAKKTADKKPAVKKAPAKKKSD